MVKATVRLGLQGIGGIMFDRWRGDGGAKTDAMALKRAPDSVYRDPDEEAWIGFWSDALKASIREASAECGTRTGRADRRRGVRAGLWIKPSFIRLAKEYAGIRPEHVTRSKGKSVTRVVVYRPYLKDWKASVELTLFDLEPDDVRNYIEVAGFKFGLLAHRPEWGRFEITGFDLGKE